jgi:DNA polymerase-1
MRVLAFDIETAAAEELHSYGPGFIRLCGWKIVGSTEPVTISTEPAELVDSLKAADAITAHNGINFDLMALASQGYISFNLYERMCTRMFD